MLKILWLEDLVLIYDQLSSVGGWEPVFYSTWLINGSISFFLFLREVGGWMGGYYEYLGGKSQR